MPNDTVQGAAEGMPIPTIHEAALSGLEPPIVGVIATARLLSAVVECALANPAAGPKFLVDAETARLLRHSTGALIEHTRELGFRWAIGNFDLRLPEAIGTKPSRTRSI